MDSQLVIGTYGTWDDFRLKMLRDYTLEPPDPKTYVVNPDGADGVIDLSEFSGDANYGQRKMKFTFDYFGEDFERLKTDVQRAFHNQRYDFNLPMDPGYTYSGRFYVDSYDDLHFGRGRIVMKIDSDPWKSAGTVTWLVNAAGGITLLLPCGRKRTCPTIEVNHEALVSFRGESWTLEPGASRINDLWIKPGQNEVTINTYPGYCIQTWSDITGAWSAHENSRWSELCAGDSPLQTSDIWTNHSTQTWADIGAVRWIEMTHDAAQTDEYAAYIQYDVKEL